MDRGQWAEDLNYGDEEYADEEFDAAGDYARDESVEYDEVGADFYKGKAEVMFGEYDDGKDLEEGPVNDAEFDLDEKDAYLGERHGYGDQAAKAEYGSKEDAEYDDFADGDYGAQYSGSEPEADEPSGRRGSLEESRDDVAQHLDFSGASEQAPPAQAYDWRSSDFRSTQDASTTVKKKKNAPLWYPPPPKDCKFSALQVASFYARFDTPLHTAPKPEPPKPPKWSREMVQKVDYWGPKDINRWAKQALKPGLAKKLRQCGKVTTGKGLLGLDHDYMRTECKITIKSQRNTILRALEKLQKDIQKKAARSKKLNFNATQKRKRSSLTHTPSVVPVEADPSPTSIKRKTDIVDLDNLTSAELREVIAECGFSPEQDAWKKELKVLARDGLTTLEVDVQKDIAAAIDGIKEYQQATTPSPKRAKKKRRFSSGNLFEEPAQSATAEVVPKDHHELPVQSKELLFCADFVKATELHGGDVDQKLDMEPDTAVNVVIPKGSSRPMYASYIKTWKCSGCEYRNPDEEKRSCRACNRTRPPTKRAALKDGKWVCTNCDFENAHTNQMRCTLCQSPNPQPQPYEYIDPKDPDPLTTACVAVGKDEFTATTPLSYPEFSALMHAFDDTIDKTDMTQLFQHLDDSTRSGQIDLGLVIDSILSLASDINSELGKTAAYLIDQIFRRKEISSDSIRSWKRLKLDMILDMLTETEESADGYLSPDLFANVLMLLFNVPRDTIIGPGPNTIIDDYDCKLLVSNLPRELLHLAVHRTETGLFRTLHSIIMFALQDQAKLLAQTRDERQAQSAKVFVSKKLVAGAHSMKNTRWTEPTESFLSSHANRALVAWKDEINYMYTTDNPPAYGFDSVWMTGYEVGRPSDLSGNKWTVVVNSYRPMDVIQGMFNDGVFLSTLAAVAQVPSVIGQVLITPKYNDAGIYKVRFCQDGNWICVTIDDRLPVSKEELMGAQAPTNQLWVALIEKAWAKVYGGYDDAGGGYEKGLSSASMSDVFSELTGAPVEELIIRHEALRTVETEGDQLITEKATIMNTNFDADQASAKITAALKSGSIVGALCGSALETEQLGLVPELVYTVVDTGTVFGTKLVKLRRPLDQGGWQGPYSEQWPAFEDPHLCAEFQRISASNWQQYRHDDCFWMSYDDFVTHFNQVAICHLNVGSYSTHFEGSFVPGKMTAKHMYRVNKQPGGPTRINVAITQDKQHSTTDMGIFVVKCDGARPQDVSSYVYEKTIFPVFQRHTCCQVDLKEAGAASYLIVPFHLRSKDSVPFHIRIHSSTPVLTKPIKSHEKLIGAFAHLSMEGNRSAIKVEQLADNVEFMTMDIGDGIWVAINNKDTNLPFELKFSCFGSSGVECTRSSRMRSEDVIMPGTRQFVMACVELFDAEWKSSFVFRKRHDKQETHIPKVSKRRPNFYTPLGNRANKAFHPGNSRTYTDTTIRYEV